MTFEIYDDFLEREDFEIIKNTFFPKKEDFNKKNIFTWNYTKGIVRDPEKGPTGYEDDDWMYNKSLFRKKHWVPSS